MPAPSESGARLGGAMVLGSGSTSVATLKMGGEFVTRGGEVGAVAGDLTTFVAIWSMVCWNSTA